MVTKVKGSVDGITLDTISDLLSANVFGRYQVLGYHSAGDGGGGEFFWDASQNKANHNGGAIIDPDVTFPSDWTNSTQVAAWFTAGSGSGCWMRVLNSEITPSMFGGIDGATDYAQSLQQALDETSRDILLYNGDVALRTPVAFTTAKNQEGFGDGTQIKIYDTGTISYTYAAGDFDDHAHKTVKKIRLTGEGTQTLYSVDGYQYGEFNNVTFQTGLVGLSIVDSYTCSGYKNHYEDCATGLKLDGITSFQEYEPYIRGSTTAGVHITGAASENITITGGAIEGNRGSAVKVDNNVTGQFNLTINGTYFELDGDTFGGATTPSFDIPVVDEKVFVRFNGGKLSYNAIAGWTSGDYNFGDNVIFSGTKVAGVITANTMAFKDCAYVSDVKLNSGQEPAFVTVWEPNVKFSSGFGATRGYVFSCPVTGKSGDSHPVTNTAPTTVPYAAVLGSGPALANNSALDYGDGDWTQITFAASAGSYGTNSVYLGNTVSGTNKQRVYSFLIQSASDTSVTITEAQTGTAILSNHTLKAGVTYKIVAFANLVVAGTQRLVLYPNSTDAPVISVLMLRQSQFNDTEVTNASALISQIVGGL